MPLRWSPAGFSDLFLASVSDSPRARSGCSYRRKGRMGPIFSETNECVYALIASINGLAPSMEIMRFKLYASTCRLISVLTCFRVFI